MKPEEDLAGISTNGARENSLKSESIFWWMHTTKTLTKKNPPNIDEGRPRAQMNALAKCPILKMRLGLLHVYNKLYGNFCCLHPPSDIKINNEFTDQKRT